MHQTSGTRAGVCVCDCMHQMDKTAVSKEQQIILLIMKHLILMCQTITMLHLKLKMTSQILVEVFSGF